MSKSKGKKNTTENETVEIEAETVAPKSGVPTIDFPAEAETIAPIGKVLQVLQISDGRLKLRHNDKVDKFVICMQRVRITQKGDKDWTSDKVLEVHDDEAEATIAFIRKVHVISSELVSKLP